MDQKEQIKGKIFNMKNHPLFKIYQDASREIKDVVIICFSSRELAHLSYAFQWKLIHVSNRLKIEPYPTDPRAPLGPIGMAAKISQGYSGVYFVLL